MDDVLCNFMESYKAHIKACPEMKYPQAQVDFFRNLEPLKGAVQAFHKLTELKGSKVYILSAPSEKNPLSYMEKRIWVENNLGYEAVNRLILSPNKALLKGDYLIDDHTEGKGQDKFEGKLINFGSVEFPDWEAVLLSFTINS